MYYLCVHVLDYFNFMDCLQLCKKNNWPKMMAKRRSRDIIFEYTLSHVNFQIPWILILWSPRNGYLEFGDPPPHKRVVEFNDPPQIC